jgi:deazaflavin-dependent oxidoreductase (nitroreductase family)
VDEEYCYLTTTGRITGRAHEIEIWFAGVGRTLYLLSGGGRRSDWVRNLEARPVVEVRIGDSSHQARARTIEPGTTEDQLARELVFAKYRARGHRDLEEWRRRALAVAIDLPD